jgi:multiple sugar transport system substrate-binding protein
MNLRIHSEQLFLVLPLLFVLGCPNSEEGNTTQLGEKAFVGQTLVIAVPGENGFAETWELILEEWSEQTGAVCQLQEYKTDNTLSLAEQFGYGDPQPGNTAATLFVFPTTRLSELVDAGLLAEVPRDEQSAEKLNWLDVFSGLRENVVSIGLRKPGAVPVSSPVLVCYYRRDLLEKAKLSPPQTWKDYQKLLDSLDRWAIGLTGVEPWGKEFRTTMFLSRAAAYAKHPENYSLFFDITTGDPTIHTPGFVRALEETLKAIERMPEEVKSYTPVECRRELFAGRAALAVTYESGSQLGEQAGTSLQRPEGMQIGFIRLPGVQEPYNRSNNRWLAPADGGINKVAFTGFSGLSMGVSSGCTPKQSRAAWNLLKRLAVVEVSTAFPQGTKSLCRESQFDAAVSWVGNDFLQQEPYEYLNAVSESLRDKQLVCELPVLGRMQFRSALTEGLDQVLDKTAQPQEALNAVAKTWRDIARQKGTQKVKNSYRLRLGLSPR